MSNSIEKYIIHANDLTVEKAEAGCLVVGLSNNDYHNFHGISKSGLDRIAKSPAHFMVKVEQTPSMRLGSAIHAAVLEPDLFSQEYILMDGVTRSSKAYKEAAKDHDPEFIIVGSEVDTVDSVKSAVNADGNAVELLSQSGWVEISAFATCPETGALIKCRFDKLTVDSEGIDLKTTQSVDAYDVEKSVLSFRYHVQHAFYNYVFSLVTGEKLDAFTFLFVEKQAPYGVKQYRLDDLALLRAEREFFRDLNLYQQCKESGEWPKVDSSLEYISLPTWALEEEDYE